MTMIEIFDPPMCCPTGICGVDVDPTLARFSADLQWMADRGVTVRRNSLTQQPEAFIAQTEVRRILEQDGSGALPIVVADGRVASRGEYPTREQLARLAGLSQDEQNDSPTLPVLGSVKKDVAIGSASCCGREDDSSCC